MESRDTYGTEMSQIFDLHDVCFGGVGFLEKPSSSLYILQINSARGCHSIVIKPLQVIGCYCRWHINIDFCSSESVADSSSGPSIVTLAKANYVKVNAFYNSLMTFAHLLG